MVIDDLDTSDAGRTALLSSTTSLAGVAGADNDTFTSVYVAVVDSGDWVADSGLTCAVATVVVVPENAAGLIVAGTAAIAAALLV